MPLAQALKPPPSRSHSKPATPVPLPSSPLKVKLALLLLDGLVGLLIRLVSGAIES